MSIIVKEVVTNLVVATSFNEIPSLIKKCRPNRLHVVLSKDESNSNNVIMKETSPSMFLGHNRSILVVSECMKVQNVIYILFIASFFLERHSQNDVH